MICVNVYENIGNFISAVIRQRENSDCIELYIRFKQNLY